MRNFIDPPVRFFVVCDRKLFIERRDLNSARRLASTLSDTSVEYSPYETIDILKVKILGKETVFNELD